MIAHYAIVVVEWSNIFLKLNFSASAWRPMELGATYIGQNVRWRLYLLQY